MPAVLEEAAKGDAVSAEESTFDEPAVEADAAPHLVMIEFAVNDADLIDGMGPGRSRDTLRAILSDLRRSAPLVVLRNLVGRHAARRE